MAVGAVVFGLTWFAMFPADASVTSDDGAYAVQVRALEQGDWSVPHRLAAVDELAAAYPYPNSSVTPDGWFPGARHAVWVRVLHVANAVSGHAGMRAVPVMSLAVAVWAAARMAVLAGHGERSSLVAGALALTSPLAFNALQLWGHVPVAAGIGAALVGAVSSMQRSVRARHLVPVVLGLGIASAIRSDGFVFALAAGAAVGVMGLHRRRLDLVLLGIVGGITAVASYFATAAYSGSVIGSAAAVGAADSRASGSVSGRLRGMVHTFFSMNDAPGSFLLVLAAFLAAALALRAALRGDADATVAFLASAAAIWIVRAVAFPRDMASGLIGAWPVALFALVRPWRRLVPEERLLVVFLLVGSLGIVVTQYDDGGGLNWGGRFLTGGLPALAVIVAGGMEAAVAKLRGWAVPIAVGCLAAAAFGASLVVDASIRTRHAQVVGRLDRLSPELTIVTASPSLPRLAWHTFPEREWLLVPGYSESKTRPAELRRMLLKANVDEVVLFGVSEGEAEVIAGRPVQGYEPAEPMTVQLE